LTAPKRECPPIEAWPQAWGRTSTYQDAGTAVLAALRPFLDYLVTERAPATVAAHRDQLFLLGGEIAAFLAADQRNAEKGIDWFCVNRLASDPPPIPASITRKADRTAYLATLRLFLRFLRQQRFHHGGS